MTVPAIVGIAIIAAAMLKVVLRMLGAGEERRLAILAAESDAEDRATRRVAEMAEEWVDEDRATRNLTDPYDNQPLGI